MKASSSSPIPEIAENGVPDVQYRDLLWMRRVLRSYYAQHGRDYPWRRESNPYLVLNTEIILQQTKADDVAVFWPSITRHLSSPERACEAGGYLSFLFGKLGLAKRKEWIVSIARIVRQHGGVPDSLDDLLGLPGVGMYTACATLAFAFGRNEGLVDSNVIKLFERFWRPFPHHDQRQKIRFWLPTSRSLGGRWGFQEVFWGLLDLSAQLCRPRNPVCSSCPLASRCNGALQNADGNRAILPDGSLSA